MADYYILNEHNEPLAVSYEMYLRYNVGLMNSGKGVQHVACDENDDFRLSTVFLGLDHGIPGLDTEPVLFETMLFAKNERLAEIDQECIRYYTWQQAETGHGLILERLKEALLADAPRLKTHVAALKQFNQYLAKRLYSPTAVDE